MFRDAHRRALCAQFDRVRVAYGAHRFLAGQRSIFCAKPQLFVKRREPLPGLANLQPHDGEAGVGERNPVVGALEALGVVELERFLLFSFQRRTGSPERSTAFTHEIEACTLCGQDSTALVLMLI